MTKSIQDYRNIVKILKLQLLKVRQENSSLSSHLGIISESETSSFTTKINEYKKSKQSFAQKVLVFLEFAHRCQLVGITPQMVFRIADKKRDKKVSVSSLTQIMKRLKLHMSQQQISKLLNAISKQKHIQYEQYLQYLSAFQINQDKYPVQSTRSYAQLTLIKFTMLLKSKYSSSNDVFKRINANSDDDTIQFNEIVDFCRKQTKELKQIQIVTLFLMLDMKSQCLVQKNTFVQQIDAAFKLVNNGVTDDRNNKSTIKSNLTKPSKKQEYGQFQQEQDTGVQKFKAKQVKKSQIKEVKKQIKLQKGTTKGIQGQLKKKGLSIAQMIQKLLNLDSKNLLVRSFSLGDIFKALKQLKNDFPKKDMIKIFKFLDKDNNGSTSTEQLVKLWIRSDDNKFGASSQCLCKLLNRHLKQTQFPEPSLRFNNFGFKPEFKLSSNQLKQVFEKLDLSEQQIQFIVSSLGNISVQEFCELLKNEGKPKPSKVFKQMSKSEYQKQSNPISKLSKDSEKYRFKKLIRLKNDGQQIDDKAWETIFTDQWACYDYCLKTASKLKTFWRDHQFGPTKNDQHGIRSIVGNQSQVPPGLPEETEIQWLTYEEIAQKKGQKVKVQFMKPNLLSTDVVQGKLGDCWYVSALSIIANDDTYIKGQSLEICQKKPSYLSYGIHPKMFHYFTSFGLYVFKFFKKFKPVYVVVDDLFPVQSSTSDLLFAKSPSLQLQWVSFAQKAYAKLHHSYSNMISGDIAQGLNDLTNALPIKESLKADNSQTIDKIKRLNEDKQLMGCSISAPKGAGVEQPVQLNDERCGLFYGHAYSIIDYLDLYTKDKNTFNLMRVRNPWGHGEWALDWSDQPIDNNPQYQKLKLYQPDVDQYYKTKKAQNRNFQLSAYKPGDDGEFLMNFNDWLSIFTNLFSGISFQNSPQYSCKYITDKWDKSTPSGLCKTKGTTQKDQIDFVKNNHQYIMEIKEETDVLMLAIQEDGRLYRGEKYPYKELVNAVIILVFTVDKEGSLKKFEKEKMTDPNNLKLQVRRDVNFWKKFQKGTYAIIPCKSANDIQQTQFEFRIYSDKEINVKKIQKGSNSFKSLQQQSRTQDKASLSSILDHIKVNSPNYG